MFGFEVVFYLFLGGLGGGLCIVAGIAGLGISHDYAVGRVPISNRNPMVVVFAFAAAVLVLGGLLLMADSGNLAALKYLFFGGALNYLSLGAWSIVTNVVLCVLLVVVWYDSRAVRHLGLLRVIHVAAIVIGTFVVLYTGLFLSGMGAVSLWNTPWLVALFFASSISCALTAFVSLMNAPGFPSAYKEQLRTVVKADVVVIILEIVCAAGFIVAALRVDPATSAASAVQASLEALSAGGLLVAWWGGFVLVGIVMLAVLDLVLLRRSENLKPYSLHAFAPTLCAFVGGFFLRYCVVFAGAHPVLGF